jgi:hypothetical protein
MGGVAEGPAGFGAEGLGHQPPPDAHLVSEPMRTAYGRDQRKNPANRRGSFTLRLLRLVGRSNNSVGYFVTRGFKAVTAPLDEMHTAPLSVPGTLIPSPVSPVTLPANLSAVGLLEPPFT